MLKKDRFFQLIVLSLAAAYGISGCGGSAQTKHPSVDVAVQGDAAELLEHIRQGGKFWNLAEENGTDAETNADDAQEHVQAEQTDESWQEAESENTPEDVGRSEQSEDGSKAESQTVETDAEAESGHYEADERWLSDWRKTHQKVRGVYVTGPVAGSAAMADILALIDETDLNAVVIDYKNDEGRITVGTEEYAGYISDAPALMEELNARGVYKIARIVCFKDPMLATSRPTLALTKADGTPVTDGAGNAWVNPCDERVWAHIVDAALAAGEAGFDEIQFDYVRFPVGTDADEADYGVTLTEEKKQETIGAFLEYAIERLHNAQIVVGADLFGTVIASDEDKRRVGQDFVHIMKTIDVVSPMIYPSHYNNGAFGLDVPDAHPYETVYGALKLAAETMGEQASDDLDVQAETALEEVDAETLRETGDETTLAVLRPWLQCFTASWVDGHIRYDKKELQAQIQAVYDAGYEEWILWNASNKYENYQ